MNKIVELPLVEPLYKTYHDAIVSAAIVQNPSIRNWFLCNSIGLTCNRKFLTGFTSPEIRAENYTFNNPYIEMFWVSMRFLRGYVKPIIRSLIDSGYYVYFGGVDDYYVSGKSWYKQKHFNHDGTICGYNQEDKTFCIYAYDSNWVHQKFWTPQKAFIRGREAMLKKGVYGNICAIKPSTEEVEFSPETAIRSIKDYLNSDFEKYPEEGEGNVRGVVVHQYIAKYVDKLFDGSIPYERMDRRVFRLIWEHTKVMHECIYNIEKRLNLDSAIGDEYEHLIEAADAMRMLYASHHMKRRDSVLPMIKRKLLALAKTEQELLIKLVNKAEERLENESVVLS